MTNAAQPLTDRPDSAVIAALVAILAGSSK